MKKRSVARRSALFVVILVVLLLPVGTGQAGAAAPAAEVPRFEPAPCPLPAPAEVSCGYLVVPENRSLANGRTIRLAVAILPAQDEN
ncbi:MAG: alpha/beta hydrolase, partial [Anaerolineae bacterium]